MAAFIPSGLPVLRGARAPATVVCPATRLRMAAPAAAGGGTLVSRRRALELMAFAAATGGLLASPVQAADDFTTTASGLKYKVVKKGTGPKPVEGDLVTIRFKGEYNGVAFDDLFKVEEPYFYRIGSGNILKGVSESVDMMSVGDVYQLSIPPALAFGSKGRRASAGKPSIPPGAYVDYTVEMTGLPGKQEELLEVTGGTIDDEDAE
ncbi:hypothetical protein MMPV_004679 [Pyropia vietnamensis]